MTITKKEFDSFKDVPNLPDTVYKYRDWENSFHKSIITDRKIFLAPPSSFEDPDDCKNPIKYELLTEQEKFEKHLYHSLERNTDFKTDSQHKQWALEMLNKISFSKNRIDEHNKKSYLELDQRIGILSLTANPKNIPMWEQYSNNHKGFCVGYYPAIMFDSLGGGGIVTYVPELPIIYPVPKHSYGLQHQLLVMHKLDKWSYEEEYRTFQFRYNPMSLKERTIQLPPESYKEIILGALIPKNIEDDLINSIPKELKNIEIKKAKIVSGKIEIVDY